jgi:hypothetical protein
MKPMFRRSLLSFSVFVAALVLVACSLHVSAQQQDDSRRGRKYKVPPPSARIEVTVLRDTNGKPIENAAVVFHPMEGERDKGAMELKTNEEGKTVIDVIPIGDIVRLQIIAHGFQTYGQDYKIDKANMAMEIRMKRPGEQYSIYKERDEIVGSGKNSGTDKPANPPKDASPPTPPAKAKPSGSGDQPDSQPSPSQPQP